MEAVWDAEVPDDRLDPGSLTIAITTMNRPDFCGKLLAQMGNDPGVQSLLDEVLVMEQGSQKVVDSPQFPGAQAALGDKLRVIEQGNIGGSGGYARGQYEALRKGTATYVMMMDDDVVCEPESIIRAVTFADLAKRPTIVGGHMFSIYDRSVLHSFGEIVQRYKFWWRSPVDGDERLGLLRAQPALVALAAPPDRRGLQRLVHVPGPDADAARDRPVAAAVHQVGRQRVRPARRRGGIPDGDVPRCRGVAHPVDRQERRARLAGLLPPPQPADRSAAALAVPPGRVAGPGELRALGQAPGLDAVLHRRAPAQGDRGCLRGSGATPRDAADGPAGDQRLPQAVARRGARGGARGLPVHPAQQAAAAREGRRHRGPPQGDAADRGRAGPDPADEQGPPALPGAPGDGDRRDGRQVVPAGQLRLRRGLDARRHVRGALPARPRPLP